MKSTLQNVLIVCSAFLMLATSCKKEDKKSVVTPTPTPTPTYTITPTPSTDKTKLNSLFSGLRLTPQSFNVTAGTYQTIYGTSGTKLSFYPNSFKDAAGHIITSGTINIQLTEMYKPGQMIANRASTASGGKLLRSGGQVYITAKKSGTEVYANKYGIGFAQPTYFSQPMKLFYGSTGNVDSITTWTPADTTTIGSFTGGTVYDTSSSFNFQYQFDSCSDFHWINCDYFYSSTSPLTDVYVVVPDTSYNCTNTAVYLIFPTINCVTSVNVYDYRTHRFDLYTSYHVPVGMTVDIVAVTHRGTSYYYYEQTGITTTSGISITAAMAPQTLSYILAQLAAL